MKRALWTAFLLGSSALAAAQQRQPAQITTLPTTSPQEFDLLDKTGAWNQIFPNSNFYVGNYGAKNDFVADDGPAIKAAIDAATFGGGTVWLAGKPYWNKTQALVVPKNVRLACAGALNKNPGQAPLDYANAPCVIYQSVAGGASIDLRGEMNGVGVASDIVHFSPVAGMTRAQMQAFIASFSGTGISIGTDATLTYGYGMSARAINVLVLGFSQCASIDNLAAQVVIHDVLGDCTSGLKINNSHDVNDLANVEFWPALTAGQDHRLDNWQISSMADNGSGLWRLTLSGASDIATGEKLWVAPNGAGGIGAGGQWTVTAINPTTIDLQGSATAPTTSGTTTNAQTYVVVGSTANLAMGMNVSGTNIPAGATIGAVWRSRAAISLDLAHPATGSGATTLTFTSPAYASGGVLFYDGIWRNGTGFNPVVADGTTCRACFAFGYAVGFNIAAIGTVWTAAQYDQAATVSGLNIPHLANQNLVPIGMETIGAGYGAVMQGATITSAGVNILNSSSGGAPNIFTDFRLAHVGSFGTYIENNAVGGLIARGLNAGANAGAILLDNSAATPILSEVNIPNAPIYGTSGGTGNYYHNNFGGGGALTLQSPTTVVPKASAVAGLMVNSSDGSSTGGSLRLTNTTAGATTPVKTIRISNTGVFQLVNSAYSAVVMSVDDTGVVTSAADMVSGGNMRTRAYGAIAGLPACNAGLQGTFTYVLNAQATPPYLGAVSTTGATVAPVFCNGVAWVYH